MRLLKHSRIGRGFSIATVFIFLVFTLSSTAAMASDGAAKAAARAPVYPVAMPPATPDPVAEVEEVLGGLGAGTGTDKFFVHHAPDPVNVRNANLFLPLVDVVIPASGPDMRVARAYNSRSNLQGSFGHGWSFNYDVHVESDGTGGYRVVDPDGFAASFFQSGVAPTKVRARISRDIARAMRQSDSDSGILQNDAYYSRVAKRLLTDDGYLEDNRERFGDYSKKGNSGRFWSTDRGLVRLEVTSDGFRRVMADGSVQVFDAKGRWTGVTDRNHNTLRARYDDQGRLSAVRDGSGRRLSFERDGLGRITRATDPIGRTWTYEYSKAGDLVKSVNASGQMTIYEYDFEHNLTRITYPDNAITQIRYDAAKDWVIEQMGPGTKHSKFKYEVLSEDGQRTRTTVKNVNGTTVKYDYDNTRGAFAITDPLGNKTTTYYSSINGQPERVVDAMGRETRYQYDKHSGALVSIKDAAGGVTKFTYDPTTGNLRSRTDRGGTSLGIQYDRRGNPVDIRGPLGFQRQFEFDESGNVSKMIDALGAAISIKYDDHGNPVWVKDPEGGIYQMRYDKVSRLTAFRDPRGGVTNFIYDKNNNVTSIVDAMGRRTSITYDAAGRRTSMTLPSGAKTTTHYNAIGQVAEISTLDGGKIAYEYDAAANLVKLTDPMGNVYRYEHDKSGRRIAAVDPAGGKTTYEYDRSGNLIASERPSGARTQFRYNAVDQLVGATDPHNGKASFNYDVRGNLAAVKNQNGDTWSAKYDDLGRLTTLKEGAGGVWKFGYDANGRKTSVTDPFGQTTKYEFDRNGRRTRIVEPAAEHRFAYGPAGEILKYWSPDGQVATFAYDKTGRMTRASAPDGTIRRVFDKAGRLRQMSGPNGVNVKIGYDKAGRIVALNRSGQSTKYTYDLNGNLTKLKDSTGAEVAFAYDALGRVVEKKDVDSGAVERLTHTPDGYTASFTDAKGVTENFAYDRAGRLLSATSPRGTAKYSYDAVGNLMQATGRNGQSVRYQYDGNGRPTGVKSSAASASITHVQSTLTGRSPMTSSSSAAGPPPPPAPPGAAAAATGGARAGVGGAAASTRVPTPGRDPLAGSTLNNSGLNNAGTPNPNTPPVGDGTGGLQITPNPDGTFTATYGEELGDGYLSAFTTLGPGGIVGGGLNYSFDIGGFPLDIGFNWDPVNGFSLSSSLTLPGGLGDVALMFREDGTISLGGELNVPLGNGGFITLRPDVSYGPDGFLAGGIADISVPGVGDFSVGFKDNRFDFLDGQFTVGLPGGSFLNFDGRLVNTPDGLAFAGDGSVVLPGGMGTYDFDLDYLNGELLFASSGNLNIPLEGGGFLSLSPEIDFGPNGLSITGPYSMMLAVGNGQFVNTSGDLSSLIPLVGYNNFCLTCWMFFSI